MADAEPFIVPDHVPAGLVVDFDYLRDPRLETAYDAQIGAGWFIVPPLFEAAPASAVAPAGEDGSR